MALAQPVSLRTLALGKIGFRAAFVLALGALLSLLGALLSGVDLLAPNALVKMAVWIAIVSAYASFWFGLARAISALGRSSSTNALALSGLWLR